MNGPAVERVMRAAQVVRTAVRGLMALWFLRFVYRYMNGEPIVWTPIVITLGVAAVLLWRRSQTGDPFAEDDEPCVGDDGKTCVKVRRKRGSTIVMLTLRRTTADGTTYIYDGPFDTAERDLNDFLRSPETW